MRRQSAIGFRPLKDPSDILNWRRINDRITTSGQPSEVQLAELRALGVTHVINLGPHYNKGALVDEEGSVTALGMTYIYIPVEFEDPTEADYTAFRHALEGIPDKVVHVHCIYNARVSAFFYRYARDGYGMSEPDASANMESIWRPGNDWAGLIRDAGAKGKKNRYKGYDY